MIPGLARDRTVATLVLLSCLQSFGSAQTAPTIPASNDRVTLPASMGSDGISLPLSSPPDPHVILRSSETSAMDPGQSDNRQTGSPATMAAPESAAPLSEFQEFVTSSLGRRLS